jgi:tripartite-type tricarboxylate transporter receptor subunit TctC
MATAIAAEYPDRPLRFIVPAAPGGSPDTGSRLLVAEFSKQMGQLIVVDNRPAASGTVATEMLARSAPDGYTVGQGNIMTLAITRSVLPNVQYDVDKDLQMVSQVWFTSNLLGVAPSLPVKSVQELIDYAKKNPGKLSYGSAGNGSTMHLSGELFKLMTGTQIVHVPYKAAQQAITEMIGGQLHFMFDNMASILPHVKAGRVRGLGVTSLKRSPAIPELPTIDEAGVPGFEMIPWAGVVVPAGVPKAIVARLNLEVNKAIASPALKEKLAALGYEPADGTPEQFDALVKKENSKWADIVKRAGAKVD